MGRLRELPIGLKVRNTNGYEYTILDQNSEDTLLRRDNARIEFTVANRLRTDGEHSSDEFKNVRLNDYEMPFVSWAQGHYFAQEYSARDFMQKRQKERGTR
jgi:hypothetical protein